MDISESSPDPVGSIVGPAWNSKLSAKLSLPGLSQGAAARAQDNTKSYKFVAGFKTSQEL